MAVKIIKNGIYYPKRVICPKCEAELEYCKVDMKCSKYYNPDNLFDHYKDVWFIECPACGTDILLEKE